MNTQEIIVAVLAAVLAGFNVGVWVAGRLNASAWRKHHRA